MAAETTTEGKSQFSTELSRDLTLFQVTLMGVGMMIGAGVFLGIGNGLTHVGPGGTMMVFTLNAMIAMFSAMSYAELSSAIPRAGGAYNFARIGFGRGVSFLAGWMEWCGSTVAGSMYAWTFAMYVLNFLGAMGWLPWTHSNDHVSIRVLAATTATLFAYINYRGASETGKLGAYITIGQTLTMALIGVLGVITAFTKPERFQNFDPFMTNGWLPVIATMGFIYVAFEGYEVIAQAGDETIEPRKNLPKAMMLSVVVVGITYMIVSFASVMAIPPSELGARGNPGRWEQWIHAMGGSDTFFSVVVTRLLPIGGGMLVVLAVVFSATSALNATIYSATRAVYALGRDNMLPKKISAISPRTRTPWIALLLTWVIIISIDLFVPSVTDVASMSSMMFLFLFLLVNVCCIRIRRHMGDELTYGYVMPLFPLIPIVAIVAQCALVVELRAMSMLAWIVGPAWILIGAVVYRVYGKSRATSTRDEIITFAQPEAQIKTSYRILMPVANPDAALEKLMPTMRLAEAYDAEVELLHMVPIPDQVPLSDAGQYMDVGREAMVEAMIYLKARFPLRETIRYCRNPARGILSAARDHQADLIITGWRGRSARADFLFGSTIDPILERNPCDVVILKDCTKGSYQNILVPFAGGPHSLLAMKTASALVDRQEGVIRPFNVTVPGKPTVDIDLFLQRNAHEFHCPLDRMQPEHAVSRDVAGTILEAAQTSDLVIVGATGERRLTQMAVGSIPEMLAEKMDASMIMVKAATPVKSILNRWF